MRKSTAGRAQTKELTQLYCGNSTNNFNQQEYLIKRTQSFQFMVRDAVTVRRTLESTMGISITAETPDDR